jgi:hypothetical protein
MKEANIISFAIKLGQDGGFFSEVSYLPVEDIPKCFKGDDAVLVRKIVMEMQKNFSDLHYYLEKEIQASNSIL